MKKWVKILLWIVGGVVALLLLLSLLAGPLAKGYVNGNGEKLVGRQVHVDHIGLNLFTGRLNVRGLNLYEDDGESSFVAFDTLDVRARMLRALGKTIDIRHLNISGLKVNVVQNGSHFNFSSMLDHFKGDEEKEKDTTPSSWVLRLGDLRLSHAQAAYHDLQRDKQWRIADMNLRVPGFVIGGKENTQAGLNIALEDGGQLNVNTDYDMESNNYSATVNISDFALRNVKEYLTDIMAISNLDGNLNAHLKADGNLSEVMKSRFSGDVELAEVGVRSIVVGPDDIVSLNSFKVSMKEINLEERRFAFDEILVDGLAATYEQWPDGNTLSRLLKKEAAEEADTSDYQENTEESGKSQSKPMRLSVGRLAVTNSNVTYDNHALPDEFHFPVTGINVEAQDLSTAGRNNARIRASLPGGGTLAVRWMGNISDMAEYQDLLLVVKGLDMKQLSPWLVEYTGQPIEDGIFGFTSHNTITAGNISGHNALDISKATVGKRRKDVDAKYKLPLKAALYVLKDKDEKINIELPVTGNVKDPEFNYMKVVWKTLGNLLVKVATSPARAIAGAVGMGGGELDFIEVGPEQLGFTSEQYHSLSELARLTATDSLLVLDMQLHGVDTVHERVLNNRLRQYMLEVGVPESQLKISVGEPIERIGYSVSSELKIEE